MGFANQVGLPEAIRPSERNSAVDTTNQSVVPPLEWRSAEIHLEVAFDGKVRSFRIHGAFARIGSGDRCEIRIPNLGLPVAAYIQVGNGYLAVVELSSTVEMPRCEIQYLLPGGSVWLLPNARVTLEALQMDQVASEAFSWEAYDMEDLRVLPNTLVLESLGVKSEIKDRENQFRLTSAISVLGTHPACQLQLKHRSVAPFQCVIFRGEHVGQPVRVVDLHALVPTQVGGRIANGDILNVGARLICGKLVLTARRMLTASPQQYVSSLPGMEMLKHRASDDGLLQPEIVLQDGLPAVHASPLVAAVLIATDDSKPNGSATQASTAMAPPATQAPATILSIPSPSPFPPDSSGGSIAPPSHLSFPPQPSPSQSAQRIAADSSNEPQTLVSGATPWEEAIERKLVEIVSAIRTANDRMASLERSLQALPSLQDNLHGKSTGASSSRESNASHQTDLHQTDLHRLVAAVARLESAMSQWGGNSHGLSANQLGPSQSSFSNSSRSREDPKPQEVRTEWMSRATGALSQLLRGAAADGQATSSDAAVPSNKAPTDKPAGSASSPSSSGRHPPRNDGRGAKSGKRHQERNPSHAKVGKAVGSNGPAANQSIHDAKADRPGQPTPMSRGEGAPVPGVRSVAGMGALNTQARTSDEATGDGPGVSTVDELIADPMDPTLAASGSPEETLVLGSLVRLRQEKANTFARRLKWALIGVGLFLAITIPLAWKSIPEGWRNLLWVSMNPWDSGDGDSP